MGTPDYMAPEQADRRLGPVGPAAVSVYTLGVILYEFSSRSRPPFDGPTALAVIRRVLGEEALSPSRLQPGVPRDLVTVCLQCLEKEPRKRYASALDLGEDLCRVLAGEPIQARRVGAAGHMVRWCRRRPLVAALIALLAGSFLAGFSGVTWKWLEADEQRDLANANARAARDKEQQATYQTYRARIGAAGRSTGQSRRRRRCPLARSGARGLARLGVAAPDQPARRQLSRVPGGPRRVACSCSTLPTGCASRPSPALACA